MADSPITSRTRLLTRSDSVRFVAPRGAISFAYGFTFASILFALFLLVNPSGFSHYSPRIINAFYSSRRSHFTKAFGHIFNNSSSSPPPYNTLHQSTSDDTTTHASSSPKESSLVNNESVIGSEIGMSSISPSSSSSQISRKEGSGLKSKRSHKRKGKRRNGSRNRNVVQPITARKGSDQNVVVQREPWMMELREDCDMFEGSWVRDDSYPLYSAGSCPHIDDHFNCFINGKSDNMHEKFRWQPKNCNIPRLNGTDMLKILRGKRLVFVGDSLNRNMWESLICILRNSVEDKSSVFEASGRQEFRKEGFYSFIFRDHNCSVEFVRSPFLVQEWEIPDREGLMKETLRLDLVERSCDKYKNADVLIFNTGHWWTHEKRTIGKEYYQEGDHIHGQLNVEDAFQKAMLTWSRWVDSNIDPKKTMVFFRGYSPSHFRGGEWNSGGQCENETEPIKNESDLSENPPMMRAIESIIKTMKTPVFFLNITKMTDFRHDAHPSMYREMNMTEETKRYMIQHQDCSHWCLPGVPDTWNELLYAHLLLSMNRNKGNPQK